jgi:signal transduction histidine kinase
MDCFLISPSAKPVGVAANAGDPTALLSTARLSDMLIRKPTVCGNPAPSMPGGANATWEILAKYHAGSLDQAMVTFRRRNLLLSGGVLFVLALGVSMALLAAERARALAEMQAEFVLGVSHELRTPLTVITVAADNLEKGMVNNAAQARSYGEIIRKHSAELSTMIEETFSLARMRSEMIQRRRFVTPEQIVNDALAENDSALRESGMNVEIGFAPELPQVDVDLHLIKRCVGNLLQNAAKYAAAGQRLIVHARTKVKRDKEMVEISVEDYGPGIPQDDLPQIFQPFYRGEAADSSHVPGIGLGLTLVKRAVEAHGGAVEVESGTTTRFSILLPSHRSALNGTKV